jgi:hypothetical protein
MTIGDLKSMQAISEEVSETIKGLVLNIYGDGISPQERKQLLKMFSEEPGGSMPTIEDVRAASQAEYEKRPNVIWATQAIRAKEAQKAENERLRKFYQSDRQRQARAAEEANAADTADQEASA